MTRRRMVARLVEQPFVACSGLRAAGEVELRLVVTLANTPARALYESLGFVVQE